MARKRLRSVSLVAGAALVLAACTSGGGGSAGGEGPSVEKGGTLTFANWQWLEPGRAETIFAAVNEYTSENPKVKIKKQSIVRADYEKTISTQIGSGGGPDIFIVPDTYFPELVESGALEPLDGVLAPEDEERLEGANEDYVDNGKQMGLVWETVPFAFFWNKKILDQAGITPPTSFDELLAAAKKIKSETGKTGFAVRHQLNEEPVWWLDHSNWEYGYGGGWSDGEKLTINSPENVEAETAFKKMYDSGAFSVGDDASTYRSKFAAGEVGMVIDNSSALLTMVKDSKVVPSNQVGASKLPFPTASSAYAGFAIGINADSKNKAIAKDYIRWMYTQDAQEGFAEGLFPSSVGTDAKPPEELGAANPWVAPFFEQLPEAENAVVKGFEAKTPIIRKIVLTQIERILTQDVDPKEALDQAQQEAEAAVE